MVKTNIERPKIIFERAIKLLKGEIPDSSATCQYCEYLIAG